MKIRFSFVNGIWQLCMVAAALRQEQINHPGEEYKDYLIVYTRSKGTFSNPDLSEFVVNVSSVFWSWAGVTQLEWMPNEWDSCLREKKDNAVKALFETFYLSGVSSVNEVWLCKLQFLHERLFADIFSKASLVLYEDGLHSYAPTKWLINVPNTDLKHPGKTLFEYKAFLRNYSQGNFDWVNNGVKRSHLQRVKKFYSVLGEHLSIPYPFSQVPIEIVSPYLLRSLFWELYERLNCKLHLSLPPGAHKFALLLGSNLSHMQDFPREQEVCVFLDVAQKLQNQGYVILWKEHPRCKQPLFDDLQRQLLSNSLILLSDDQKLPIEILLSNHQIGICCSTLSSSLFYLKHIYEIRTETCVKPLQKFLKNDFLQLSELTSSLIGSSL